MPPDVMTSVLKSIEGAFDGSSVGGPIQGTYKMADGSTAKDTSIVVWVNVDPSRVDDVRKKAGVIARILKQESLYFEVTDIDGYYVPPSPDLADKL